MLLFLELLKDSIDENYRKMYRKSNHLSIQPRETNEHLKDTFNVTLNDVCGLAGVSEMLRKALSSDTISGVLIPRKKILLFGPPGTGKTCLVKAVAACSQFTYFSVHGSELLIADDPEVNIQSLFQSVGKQQPSMIFIDDIEGVCDFPPNIDLYRKVKDELICHIQRLNEERCDCLVIAATNSPWKLDPAVEHCFEHHIYIPLPGRI